MLMLLARLLRLLRHFAAFSAGARYDDIDISHYAACCLLFATLLIFSFSLPYAAAADACHTPCSCRRAFAAMLSPPLIIVATAAMPLYYALDADMIITTHTRYCCYVAARKCASAMMADAAIRYVYATQRMSAPCHAACHAPRAKERAMSVLMLLRCCRADVEALTMPCQECACCRAYNMRAYAQHTLAMPRAVLIRHARYADAVVIITCH